MTPAPTAREWLEGILAGAVVAALAWLFLILMFCC